MCIGGNGLRAAEEVVFDVQVHLHYSYYNKITESMNSEKLPELLEDLISVMILGIARTSFMENEVYNCRAKLPDLKQTFFMCLLME